MEAYIRACANGQVMSRRWRLMVLGPSGDGKTSLINRLLGKGFTEDHIVTNGLETDCRVEITRCDAAWKEYEADHLELLDEGVTHVSPKPCNDRNVKFDETESQRDSEDIEMLTRNRLRTDLHAGGELTKFILSIGDVMYYILHHIFLRWRCVYILVVNLARPLHSEVPCHELPAHARRTSMTYCQSIEFWLNMIYSHMVKNENKTDLPNVVLVGTHKDLLDPDPNKQNSFAREYFTELQNILSKNAHFPQVHSTFISVDSKGGDPENYRKLRSLIFDLVKKHCSQSRLRPVRWLGLEKKLHELEKSNSLPYLDKHLVSYESAMMYGKEFRLKTHKDMQTFLEYHHITCDITYFGGEGLGHYIVPHPQWLIDILRALITIDQFYPKMQKCIQEKNKLESEGLLQTDGFLLTEVWKPFLRDDKNGAAKQYLLNLMVKFDLAAKFASNQYIIPCLLPILPSLDIPGCRGLSRNLPGLYFKFHNSRDSYAKVKRGNEAYDNFLPHGLFQKLISKCSKQGWRWTEDKYQDAVVFRTADVQIALQARDTWIVLNVYSLSPGVVVSYHEYHNVVYSCLENLLNQYHPNMWIGIAVNPCEMAGHDCPIEVGPSSVEKHDKTLRGAACSKHSYTLTTSQFKMWFNSSSCRALTENDLNKVGKELTDRWKQMNIATELGIPESEVTAINENYPEIQLASFKILMFWYNQQIYKVDAFASLCIALEQAGLACLLEKCLGVPC